MSESQNFEESILTLLPPEDVNYDSKQFEDLHDGYLFGKYKNYRLKAKLGEGGMGQTWLAEELVENEVSQRVVLKILTWELRGNADALKEVRRVFDLTKNLNHSSICPLLGRYVDPNFGDFLVMKYADGGTLADWFNAQPGHENGLPLETLLPIFRPLAEALDLAHRNGILHRDVKPQNIMFMGKTPVLIDFGIAARIRPENVTLHTQSFCRTDTMAHSSSGTPRYMAPEQMEGERQNAHTDQYALATVLYEMLNGSLPFMGNIVLISFQKLRFDPRSSRFSMSVNAALTRALSYDAAERFSTCTEFLNALPASRLKFPLWGAAALVVTLFVGALIGNLAKFKPAKEADPPVPPAPVTEYTPIAEVPVAPVELPAPAPAAEPAPASAVEEIPIIEGAAREKLKAKLKELGLEYKITDDSVTITKYTGSSKTLAIPDGVTSIGKGAFSSCSSLTTVTIPNSVTSIGDEAFWGCHSLTSVTIPDSVTSIGGGPFTGCDKLTEIRVSAGNTHFKSVDGILFTADGKTLIQVPKGKGHTEYTIPDGVTSIGDHAFSGCESLTSVTIPDSVTSIGDRAFRLCESLTSVTIPNSVTSIGDDAFSHTSLTSVTIPDSVTSIGEGAFEDCESLTSVTIPNSVTSIGDHAFYGCSSLTSVTIPDSVTSIGGSPFAACDQLTKIRVSAGNTHFKSENGILFTADGKTFIQFPAGKSLTKYTIPDSVTSIGNEAFSWCKSLTSVTIPESVTSIGDSAFSWCESLTICGKAGSEAERYAKKEGIKFQAE